MIEQKPIERKSCIIIPTYNHIQFLPEVLQNVKKHNLAVIVVDDGSTDGSAEFLEKQRQVSLVRLPKNQGKGKALKAGLNHAQKAGYDLAVCIDSDGQHDPQDIPRLITAAQGRIDTMVIGAREHGQNQAPRKSRFGRVFSNFWIWIETGKNVPDTQSGFRLYPIAAVNQLTVRAARYGWEVEILARAIWGGVNVVSVPIAISYAAKKDSHFRVGWDFFLVSCTNAYLVARRLLPLGYRQVVKHEKIAWPKGLNARMHFFWDQYLWQIDQTPGEKAMAIGVGVFCGIVPIWGWQTIFALYMAQRLHLNKVLTLIGANISIPPMIPLILYTSVVLGRWILTQELHWQLQVKGLTLELAQTYLKELIVGSSVLAVLAGIIIGLASHRVFRFLEKRKGYAK